MSRNSGFKYGGPLILGVSMIAMFVVSPVSNAASCNKYYRISAGVLKHYTNKRTRKHDVRISNYTYRIPFYRKSKLNPYYFGAVIRPRHRRPYTIQVTYEIPAKNKVNKDYFESVSLKGRRLVLQEKPVTVKGKSQVRMRLSTDDVPGRYKAKIKVNKRWCRTLTFTVYKPRARKRKGRRSGKR